MNQRRDPEILRLMKRTRRQATFPTLAPQGGDTVYRTDLTTAQEPEHFYRDGAWSRWISIRSKEIVFSFPASRSGHGDVMNSLQGSATFGYLMEYNFTYTGMWLLRDTSGALETYRITANGVDAVQASFNLTGDLKSYNLSLNVNGNAGDILSCRLLSGSTVGRTLVHLRVRRRI
jgi:hypothetical protein